MAYTCTKHWRIVTDTIIYNEKIYSDSYCWTLRTVRQSSVATYSTWVNEWMNEWMNYWMNTSQHGTRRCDVTCDRRRCVTQSSASWCGFRLYTVVVVVVRRTLGNGRHLAQRHVPRCNQLTAAGQSKRRLHHTNQTQPQSDKIFTAAVGIGFQPHIHPIPTEKLP